MDESAPISRKMKVIFTGIIFLIFALMLEYVSYIAITKYSDTGAFNTRVFQANFHPYMGWEPPFGAVVKTSDHDWSRSQNWHITTDAKGRPQAPLTWDDPDVTIVVTGGSTVFGVGSTDEKTTMPALLQKRLSEEHGIKAAVVNLGVRSYTSFQELVRLQDYFLTERADLVVSVTGVNDISNVWQNPPIKYALMKPDVFEKAELVRKAERQETIVLNLDGFLRSRSYFIDLLSRVITKLGTPKPGGKGAPPVPTEADYAAIPHRADIMFRNYALMRAATEYQGGRFFAYIQPNALARKASIPYTLKDVTADEFRDVGTFHRAFYKHMFAQKGPVEMRDILDVFDAFEGEPLTDRFHYSDAGANQVAGRIIGEILPAVRASMASRSR